MNKVIPFLLGCVSAISLWAQSNINIQYGSPLVSDAFGFLDTNGVGLTTGSALVTVGYFSSLPTSFAADSSTFNDFIVLDSSTTFGGGGYFNSTASNVDVSSFSPNPVGLQPWIAVFDGITNIAQIALSTGYGLYSNQDWAPPPAPGGGNTIPSGSSPPAPAVDYNIRTTTFDQIAIGSEVAGGGPGTGVGYQLAAPIPEPSALHLFALGSLGLLLRRRR